MLLISQLLLAVVAVFNFGGVVADAMAPATARQHIHNPRWPPHAKFHNGQTMMIGVLSGLLALVLIFGVHPLTLPIFFIAAAVASTYFVAMLLAPLFPGTAWVDPEFASGGRLPLGLPPQKLVSLLMCFLALAAVSLASLALR